MLAFRSLARMQAQLTSAPYVRQACGAGIDKIERGTTMKKQGTRKSVARGLVLAAALLFVVAKAQPAAAPANQAPAAGKPRIGGTLKFGIVKDIGTPIPFVAYTSISQYVKDNVYEPLVMFD